MPVFRGTFTTTAKVYKQWNLTLYHYTHLFQNAQENAPSVPKFRMVKSLNWKTFIIILFLPQSLGYFGALAVSGFSLGTFTVAGGPVKGIAYSMNGNGEEIEYWPHEDGTTICTKRNPKMNSWATINNDIKRKAHERIDEYNGRQIRNNINDEFRIDIQGDTTDGYINIQIQLDEHIRPSTFATVIHKPNVPNEHVRKGLHKSIDEEKLCELKEAEKPMVSDVDKERYDPSTRKRKGHYPSTHKRKRKDK